MARNPELLDDVSWEGGAKDGDDFFTRQGDDKNSWNSESSADNAEDIQARPVSKLEPKQQFDILQRWWYADADYSAGWRRQSTDDLGFVAGDQLSDDDKALLDEQQRPHVVFNRVLTIIKAVAGMEINGRHEIQFSPENNDDTQTAEVLQGVSKWMGQKCDAEDEESSAFQQSTITGLGVTEARFSYERKSNGEYIEEMFDCREFGWDRTARKKNLTDARRMWRVRKMPLADGKQMFPGKSKRQLNATWADTGIYQDKGPRSIEEKRIRDGKDSYLDWDDTDEITVVHMQWWEREPYYLVADEQTNTKMELSVPEFRKLDERMKKLGMPPMESVRLTRQVFKHAFLGNEILQPAQPAPLGDQFSWGVITGEWDAKKRQWYGLIRTVRDPQQWANKFMSQVMQIMNSTAKGGILAETDAFDDEIDAEEGYALPDAITWVKNGALSGQKPKIMPKPGQGDASAYVSLLQYAVQAVMQVTGVNFELLGQQDLQNPGVVEAMRKQAGMTVLATLFDALRRYRKIVGRQRLYIIQNRLSDGRIIRIVGQQYTGAVQLAKNVTAGEYDVVVDDAPTSPNQKEANWAIIQPMLAVFKDQILANPDVFAMVLEYSPLPSQLVQAIKKTILQKQSDPAQQQDQQKMKELAFAKLLSEVSLNDAKANQANSQAKSAEGTQAYDLAIAQNMMNKHQIETGKLVLDAHKAAADADGAKADAELTKAKTVSEIAGVHHDAMDTAANVLNARTAHIQASHDIHSNAVGALAGAHHDLAAAFQKRVAAIHQARTPIMDPNKQQASDA